MVFRIFDIAFGKMEWGFTLGSFLFDDDDFKSLLGVVHQRKENITIIYLAFYGVAIDWDGTLDDDRED